MLPRHRRVHLSLALLLAACGSAPDEPRIAPPWTSPPGRVGAEQCADCHREQASGWERTGMARSLGPVSLEEVAPLGGRLDPGSGYRYDFVAPPEGPGLLETHPDDPLHRRAAPLVLAVGSGRQDRSYVLQEGSLLWFAPLEAVTVPEGRVAQLAPPHAIDPGLRFGAPITGECLGCHTDAPPPRDHPLNVRPQGWQPRGISCAACHAGGDEHVAHRESGARGEDPILGLESLSRVERLSICAACHLQGDARIVLEAGELGPPRPGGDLLEERALFVAAEATDEVGFVSQVERLVLSRCFTASEMLCASCHDPHHTLADEDERLRVRAACLDCHAGDAAPQPDCTRASTPEDPDCVSCHMPLRPVFDVEGIEIHDHWIRTRPGSPPADAPLRFAESPTGDWRRFAWPGAPPPEHVDDPGLLMMALHSRSHTDRARALVDEPVHGEVAALPMYHHVRGVLLEDLGRAADAEAAYRRALELDPAEAASATNLALLLARRGDADGARELLEDVLRRYPRAEGAYRNRALLRHAAGDVGGFLEDLVRAFELRPQSAVARTLASAFDALGDRARGQEWRERAQRFDAR